MKWMNKVVVLLLYNFITVFANTDDFTPPTLSDGCACPGETLTYSCTISGDLVVAIWSGTAFNCPASTNRITIFRSTFESGLMDSPPPSCGPFYTSGVSVDNSTGVLCYSSMVSVNVSRSLNGISVMCSRNDVPNIIGTPHTLSVAGAAPISLTASTISRSTFTFSWTPTESCSSISSYQVIANESNCGSCSHNPGTNTATCSRWDPTGQTCSVSVMSVVCGGVTGDPSESLNLLLAEPNPPTVSVALRYSVSNSSLLSVSVEFPIVSQVEVAPGLRPPVTYSIQFNSDPQEGSEIRCSGEVCNGTVTNIPTENFDLTVVTFNSLGNGRASPSVRVLTNISSNLSVNVNVVGTTATFTVNVLEGVLRFIRLEYTNDGVVSNITNSSNVSAEGVYSIILTTLENGAPYNYSLFVTLDGVELELLGTFSTRCQPDALDSSDTSTNDNVMCSNFTGGVSITNGEVCYTGTTPGGGFFAQTFCNKGYRLESGASQSERRYCQSNGIWSGSQDDCILAESFPLSVVVAVVIVVVILAAIVIAILIILYCCLKKKDPNDKSSSSNAEKQELAKSSFPPPPDTLYADPNAIEHQTTATGEEYALVERKSKKEKVTQPGGLYQDPNAIDHHTAPSGEMYAVVDKPKRGSSKKREPDVVPPGNTGLTYADIDVSTNRNKPRARQQQQAQHPGHVEYADIHPGSEHARL